MPDIHTRRDQILATLLEQDWLRANPALVRTGNTDALLALTLDADLGLDSLDRVAAVIEVEDEWDFDAADAEIDALRTVGDVVALVERRTASPRG